MFKFFTQLFRKNEHRPYGGLTATRLHEIDLFTWELRNENNTRRIRNSFTVESA